MPQEPAATEPLRDPLPETPFPSPESPNAPEAPLATPEQPEQALEGASEQGAYETLLSQMPETGVPAGSGGAQEIAADAATAGALTDEESRVGHLVVLAETKGVAHAVSVARSMKDYYALDRMHDELQDSLRDRLLEKGLISEE